MGISQAQKVKLYKKIVQVFDEFDVEIKKKCTLCNETLTHVVAKIEAETGASRRSVCQIVGGEIGKNPETVRKTVTRIGDKCPKTKKSSEESQKHELSFSERGENTKKRKPAKAKFNVSDIEWTDWTWNPVTGCEHGCEYCYARRIAHRFSETFPKGFKPDFHKGRLAAPRNMGKKKSGRVFVCSMADLFGDWVPDSWIEQVLNACVCVDRFTYIFLTKNPGRLADWSGLFPSGAWVGATVDRAEVLEESLLGLEAVSFDGLVRFVSFEPLLEIIDVHGVGERIDWAVIGPETGNRAGRFIPDLRDVVRMQIDLEADGCPVFLKPSCLDLPLTMDLP